MRRRICILLFSTLLLTVACDPLQRQRTAAVLDDIESYINERPDSALAVLRGLDSKVVRKRALRARAALLHSMALDKCYIDIQSDSILFPAVSYYSRHGSPDEKLRTQYYLGRLQYNAGKYQEAIVTYTEALALTDHASDYKYIGFVNQAIADTYAATYQESDSFPYLDHAYEAFLQIPDQRFAKLTLYKKATALTKQKVWSEADSLYSYLLTHPEGIEELESQITADYALLKVLSNPDDAQEAADMFAAANNGSGAMRSANLWAAYAFCLSRKGETEQAVEIFRQLDEVYPGEKRVLYWRVLMETDAGRYREALDDYQKVIAYQDSLVSIQLNHSTLLAQKQFFEKRELLARQLAQRRVFLLWLSVFLACFLAGTGVILHRRRIRRSQHENARLQQLIETVRRQVVTTGEEQTFLRHQFSLLFQDFFNTLGKICADYEEGKIDGRDASDRAVLRRLDRIIWDFTGKGGDHEEFDRLLDKHLNNIMSDFRRDFPKMRAQAYYLVGYIFAGLDMQTIGVLMGVDIDALYARKHRIKSEITKSSSPEKSRYLELFH